MGEREEEKEKLENGREMEGEEEGRRYMYIERLFVCYSQSFKKGDDTHHHHHHLSFTCLFFVLYLYLSIYLSCFMFYFRILLVDWCVYDNLSIYLSVCLSVCICCYK
ncbi:hypothetical protein DFA_11231 [Cavenderia fasciculata]|uniref:Transmembrane protein n=1 Tax=Cavenderia fasciculata TaxID=261658 RepID=F4QFL7_CACFS|nr:uncharacterized protein DFA_11231 [Cavenderia fasciculata]EGG13470.1 hypothetical protein DFA_11231 [Cavenderia fasciculata]|eukprot:XP_004350174.1 hypothetical protein DFA_11231 [Cavenderia fasciculata]